ncbi:MAG: biotin--[acetyl-CoA-carboxylase] ligase [Actinomycetota bacterium]|nr:biotin--[acetyl-CoA-carboxylase] ligase [Actinomycetota bacterium]
MADGAAKRAMPTREIRWLLDVDSTNLRLAAVAHEQGAAAQGIVIVADHQTAGRGRRGRTWEAPPGSSLLVSVILDAPALTFAPLATVCAALAAAGACEEATGHRPTLKWPNDVMIGAAKLGGILAETVSPQTIVVGLGLNVDWGGAPLPYGATSLADIPGAPPVDRRALLTSYLCHLDEHGAALHSSGGRARLLDGYRDSCSTLGGHVTVDLGRERITGTATGVTEKGSLVVTTDAGAREVAAGDVVHVGIP